MARFRSIHPAVWENKDLRRLGWVARNVFLYLFSKAADDEGRFRADSYSILEGAFGRGDPVTEADVADAMQSLADIEEPMVLLYGEHGQYGFLSGWFMHQYMQARYREESALPPPPVEVSSWAKADEVRDRYMAEKRLGKTASYRDAIRWFVGLSLESGQANSGGSIEAHQSDSREALENLQANRKGKGNRKGSTPSAPPCDAGPEKQSGTETKPANSARAQLVQDLWEAFGFEGSPPSKRPAAFSGAMRLLDGKAEAGQELVELIKREPHTPGNGDSEAGYFLAMLKDHLAAPTGVGWRKQGGDQPSTPILLRASDETPTDASLREF